MESRGVTPGKISTCGWVYTVSDTQTLATRVLKIKVKVKKRENKRSAQ